MAIAYEEAAAISGTSTASNPTLTPSISIQNASGNDRVLALFVHSHSGQSGDLTISSVTFNSVAPSSTVTLNSTGTVREVYYMAVWNDAALPATAGSYSFSFTIGNHGANPGTSHYAIEMTSVDQTTIPAETAVTATNFGTTGQTYTPSLGDDILALIAAQSGSTGTNPTFSWGADTELIELNSGSIYENGMAVGRSTDGSITGTSDSDLTGEGWIGMAFNAVAAGGTGAKNPFYPRNPLAGCIGV